MRVVGFRGVCVRVDLQKWYSTTIRTYMQANTWARYIFVYLFAKLSEDSVVKNVLHNRS